MLSLRVVSFSSRSHLIEISHVTSKKVWLTAFLAIFKKLPHLEMCDPFWCLPYFGLWYCKRLDLRYYKSLLMIRKFNKIIDKYIGLFSLSSYLWISKWPPNIGFLPYFGLQESRRLYLGNCTLSLGGHFEFQNDRPGPKFQNDQNKIWLFTVFQSVGLPDIWFWYKDTRSHLLVFSKCHLMEIEKAWNVKY